LKAELFVLCDAATLQGEKLNLLGTFDTIRSRLLPAVRPHMAIAFILRFTPDEAGMHDVRVSFTDADGKPVVAPLENNVAFPLTETRSSGKVPLVYALQGLPFFHFGDYAVQLFVDSQLISEIPLFITPE
jgi:hypothetical protein